MVAITGLCLFVLGVSSAYVQKRQTVARVFSDLQTLNTSLNQLTTALNNYDGTIGGVAPIQQRTNTVLSNIRTTTTDVSNTPSADDSTCSSYANYIRQTIGPSVQGAINALIAQKQKLINAGAKTIVQNNVKYLQGNFSTLERILTNGCSSRAQATMTSSFESIVNDMNRAQNAYA